MKIVTNLGEILYNKTVVERIHLGEEKFWCWRLHTGTRVAFLIKTDRKGGLLVKHIFSRDYMKYLHVHALNNFHVNLDFFAELEQLRETIIVLVC